MKLSSLNLIPQMNFRNWIVETVKLYDVIILAVLWFIWKARYKFIFQGEIVKPLAICFVLLNL